MTLAAGTKLGPYEILAPLGAGGMGEVYRARDTKLARDVALKVLPEAFAKDGERMARFQREAQMLASLNHPNIASIYGLEESGGVRALVMELVEGPTLAERIATSARRESGGAGLAPPARAQQAAPLPLDEALSTMPRPSGSGTVRRRSAQPTPSIISCLTGGRAGPLIQQETSGLLGTGLAQDGGSGQASRSAIQRPPAESRDQL